MPADPVYIKLRAGTLRVNLSIFSIIKVPPYLNPALDELFSATLPIRSIWDLSLRSEVGTSIQQRWGMYAGMGI